MTLRERLFFAVGGFGQNLVVNLVNLFLLAYLYGEVGLSSAGIATLTIVLTAAKIWDAVNDVIAGVLLDRTRTRWGAYRPWILFTAAPVALLTTAMFAIPDTSEGRQILLIAAVYVLWDLLYTLSDVPYWSLTSVVTTDEPSRTRLIAWARTAGMLALAVMTLAGPVAAKALGWTWFATAVCAAGMALFTLAFFGTRERVAHTEHPPAIRESLRRLGGNRPLFLLLLSGALGFGRFVIQVGGAVVATVVFGDVALFSVLGAALIAGIIIATMATPVILRRTTRLRLMVVSSVAAAAVYVALYAVGHRNLVVVSVVIGLSGLLLGVFTVTQTTMIGDTADLAEVRTGDRSDASCFAGLTFVTKLANALATMAFGLAVSAVGYHSGVHVTDAMKDGVWMAVTLVPALSCLLGILPLRWYAVPEAELPLLLSERRASSSAGPAAAS